MSIKFTTKNEAKKYEKKTINYVREVERVIYVFL